MNIEIDKDTEHNDPGSFETREHLLDGSEILIRSIKPSDREYLIDVWAHLSPLSRYYRFMTPKQELTEKELDFFTQLDFDSHVGLIALRPESSRMQEYGSGTGEVEAVGTGRYITSPIIYSDNETLECDFLEMQAQTSRHGEITSARQIKSAELAFTIEDAYHGQGVATLLLKHLRNLALKSGIETFFALVLAENKKMLEVFEHCGLPVKKRHEDYSTWLVELELQSTPAPGSLLSK